ncbi:hypothetical protein FPOAC2_11478 [Fusarium poae]|jgi:hypothetical protein|uniref:hypothetical protein n=1 Tax=Fusarium poae TaxID=36050 RepID=UPI001CE975A1|nr:hypothetical protein FPOAC1_011173 [Fusarium poae]KAG8666368.1 hypothetical protein FPOAC1_011173 [Fusarium poae]
MGNSSSKFNTSQLSAEELQDIPNIIRMSYQNSWKKYACFTSMNISLGPPDAEPMYTISFTKGLYGDIVLHKGPTPESPAIATSSRIKQYHDDYLITLPTGKGIHEETLRRPKGLKGRFWFGCLVGDGPEQRVERFEWRRSRGAEVKSVGQSKWGGYKLVRLGSTNTKEEYSSSEEDFPEGSSNSGEGYTSDGKEIVGVWGNASCWKTMSGVGEFQFRGSGATGELGNMWALMAVMSCMSIWQKVQRDNATAGASASSASSSSAAAAAAAVS